MSIIATLGSIVVISSVSEKSENRTCRKIFSYKRHLAQNVSQIPKSLRSFRNDKSEVYPYEFFPTSFKNASSRSPAPADCFMRSTVS